MLTAVTFGSYSAHVNAVNIEGATPRTKSTDRFRSRYGPWALVTGASDGMGRAIAQALARRGLNLILAARNKARLDVIAEELKAATGVETLIYAVDLADPDGAAELAEAVEHLDRRRHEPLLDPRDRLLGRPSPVGKPGLA